MARIPPIKRLTTEDFKEQAAWISKLFYSLNLFMESVTGALNKGLTFTENMNSEIKEIVVSIPSSGSAFPFTYTAKIRPVAVWIGSAVEVAASPSPITSALYADWEYVNGSVRINNITGLTAGKKYRITLISIAG